MLRCKRENIRLEHVTRRVHTNIHTSRVLYFYSSVSDRFIAAFRSIEIPVQ